MRTAKQARSARGPIINVVKTSHEAKLSPLDCGKPVENTLSIAPVLVSAAPGDPVVIPDSASHIEIVWSDSDHPMEQCLACEGTGDCRSCGGRPEIRQCECSQCGDEHAVWCRVCDATGNCHHCNGTGERMRER